MTDVANIVLPSIHKVHFSTHSYQERYVKYLNVSEEGGEATWLFSDISTIPVSELNLSSTLHRKKLILESSCVHIKYVKKSGYTSESKGTQLLLHDQNVFFCNKPAKLIKQVLTITQTTLSSF